MIRHTDPLRGHCASAALTQNARGWPRTRCTHVYRTGCRMYTLRDKQLGSSALSTNTHTKREAYVSAQHPLKTLRWNSNSCNNFTNIQTKKIQSYTPTRLLCGAMHEKLFTTVIYSIGDSLCSVCDRNQRHISGLHFCSFLKEPRLSAAEKSHLPRCDDLKCLPTTVLPMQDPCFIVGPWIYLAVAAAVQVQSMQIWRNAGLEEWQTARGISEWVIFTSW